MLATLELDGKDIEEAVRSYVRGRGYHVVQVMLDVKGEQPGDGPLPGCAARVKAIVHVQPPDGAGSGFGLSSIDR